MNYSPPYRLGPSKTPKQLKFLIMITLIASLLSAICDNLFPNLFGLESPQKLLSLSLWGIHHLFLWQFITYVFVHPITHGVTISFLLYLAFNAYLLWVIGALLIEKKGLRHLFILYFTSALFSGLSAFYIQSLTHSVTPFSGNWTALYALLVAWIMAYPDLELLLFLTVPIKAKHLVLVLLGATLLIDLSIGDFVNVVAYCTGAIVGYIYGVMVLHLRGPFQKWHRFEDSLMSLTSAKKENPYPYYTRAKVYDFKTGQAILSDEEFTDAMLTKISTQGKESLTWKERFRLRKISRKKKKMSFR